MKLVRVPSSRAVRQTIKYLILQQKAHIEGRMADVDLSASNNPSPPTLQLISHSFRRSNNIAVGSLPSFQIEDLNQTGGWQALPNVGTFRYRFRLWGLLKWEQQEEAQDLISEYAAGLGDILNQRHVPIPLGEGYFMYFNGIMPLSDIEYGAMEFANGLCNGFSAAYTCDIDASLPDSAPQSNIP